LELEPQRGTRATLRESGGWFQQKCALHPSYRHHDSRWSQPHVSDPESLPPLLRDEVHPYRLDLACLWALHKTRNGACRYRLATLMSQFGDSSTPRCSGIAPIHKPCAGSSCGPAFSIYGSFPRLEPWLLATPV